MNEAAKEVVERLDEQPILTLDVSEWDEIADQFEVVEHHPTFISGDLLIIRLESGFAAVERPIPNRRVIRRLGDLDEVHRFVTNRLEEYERMWDGCGCKIDYYS